MGSSMRNIKFAVILGRSLRYPVPMKTISTTAPLNVFKLYAPYLMDLQQRKEYLERIGKYKTFERHQFIEWNYEAERYAFCVRINEKIEKDLLIKALDAENFDELFSLAGKKQVHEFCNKYLRYIWPSIPEEGIQAAFNFLVNEKTLATVAVGIGMKDLITRNERHVSDEVYANCFYSLVNAISNSTGKNKGKKFILDILITQLVGKNIWDFWDLSDPYEAVQTILINSGGVAEPRVLGILGKRTIETVCRVGIYSDKKELLGEGCEENLDLALKIASYNCLSNFFDHSLSRNPINFECVPYEINEFDKPNVSIKDFALKA